MVWGTFYDNKPDITFTHTSPPKQQIAANAKNLLDHISKLDMYSAPAPMRLSGIICSIGTANSDVNTLEKMLEAGMNIARLNFGYGSYETHKQTLDNLTLAVDNYSKRIGALYPLAIALDIKGPQLRTGYLEHGASTIVKLKKGDTIKLTSDKKYQEMGTARTLYVDYEHFHKLVQEGSSLFLDHGSIALKVLKVRVGNVICLIENGGIIGNCKVINVPGVTLDLPTISEKDKEDLVWGLRQGVDIVFASYTTVGISEIRNILGLKGAKIALVAKIENYEGIESLNEILGVVDAIMVNRADLGIELPPEKLAIAQKRIIARCNKAGKPVIVANQLLESMINNPRPSPAECCDIANAILDGADCVMLSSETDRGDFPVESILVMGNICKEAESTIWYKKHFEELKKQFAKTDESLTVAISCVELATKCMAVAIVIVSYSGKAAVTISKYHPHCPIIAVISDHQLAKQANLCRGIVPVIYLPETLADFAKDQEARISYGISFGKWRGLIKPGDSIVILYTSGNEVKFRNMLRILYVTETPPGEKHNFGPEPVDRQEKISINNEMNAEEGDVLQQ